MQELKHTPGPWRLRDFPYRIDIDKTMPDGATLIIAGMAFPRELLSREVYLNATLIAAAPDLLEACELALEVVTDKWLLNVEKARAECAEKLKTAIAKATGQQPA